MSLFGTISKGIAALTGNTLLVRMARECGWPILAREGCGVILQVGVDHASPPRDLMVIFEEGEPFYQFDCDADLRISADAVPVELCAFLLDRNVRATLGAWHMANKGGRMQLCFRYRALAGGLSAALFKAIGLRSVKEVAEVEALMRQKGWV